MSTPPELEEVQEDFNMGIICAQQVLAHFADRLGLTEETALRIPRPSAQAWARPRYAAAFPARSWS